MARAMHPATQTIDDPAREPLKLGYARDILRLEPTKQGMGKQGRTCWNLASAVIVPGQSLGCPSHDTVWRSIFHAAGGYQTVREQASSMAVHSRGSVAVERPATLIRPVPTM